LRRGDAQRHLKRYEDAITSYDQAQAINPDDFWAHYKLGDTFRYLERYEAALKSYQKAIDLKPDDEYAWYNCACCAVKIGDISLAMESLESALLINRNFQELLKNDPDLSVIRDRGLLGDLLREINCLN
jgi:tetratricopeptide (TPR) repeat protein